MTAHPAPGVYFKKAEIWPRNPRKFQINRPWRAFAKLIFLFFSCPFVVLSALLPMIDTWQKNSLLLA